MTTKMLAAIRISVLIAAIVGILALSFWIRSLELVYVNIPLHSMMESMVALLSLTVAFFIYKFDAGDHVLTRHHVVALSLIAIGVLSLFHAAAPEGSVLVWCYVAGRLIGSVLLMGGFFSERQLSASLFRRLPYGVVGMAFTVALMIYFQGYDITVTDYSNAFTAAEKSANGLAALLFFLGAILFLRRYLREYQNIDFYFGTFLLLLATTSFYFQFSRLWAGGWWLWHIINLIALGVMFYYFIGYIEAEKKRWMEGRIDEERIKFMATFEQAAVGMAHVSPDGKWLKVNQKLCDIVGYNQEELLGLTFQNITHPDDLMEDLHYVEEMLGQKRDNYTMRKRYIRKNGSIIWIDLSVSLIWKNKQPDFFVAVIVDVDEEVKAKEAINAFTVELENKVAERTVSLQNAYDEMEAFTYSVSHDLRSPLRATDGFSQALLEDYGDKLDSTARDYLARIRVASQKMAGLIDDLLQLSRQTRTDMKPKTIDLAEMARSIMAEFRAQEPERSVDVVINQGLSAYADLHLMNVVLTNLLGNAWKYTSKHPHAIIEFGKTQQNGERVFYIRDNGAGFDMAYVNKLFKPFQRLHTVQEFAGNGIGLAMVSRIIKRHFGKVWAHSEIEKGTTIYFTLGLSAPLYIKEPS